MATQDLWGCAVVSGTGTLAADALMLWVAIDRIVYQRRQWMLGWIEIWGGWINNHDQPCLISPVRARL